MRITIKVSLKTNRYEAKLRNWHGQANTELQNLLITKLHRQQELVEYSNSI